MSAIPTSTNIFVTSNNAITDILYDFTTYNTIQPGNVITATNIDVSINDLNQIFNIVDPIGSSTSGITTNINSTIQGKSYDLGQLFGYLTGIIPFTAIGDYSYTYDYATHKYYITFNTIGGIQFNKNLSNVEIIVVGGGGAGGGCDITRTGSCGAGGGGGGVTNVSTSVTNNPLTGLIQNNMYYINVGIGGNGVASGSGLAGGTSYFIDISGTPLITSTGGQGGPKTNTNIIGGLGGSSTYTSIFTPVYSTVITGYGGTGGKNDNGTIGLGGFGSQCALSYQNYLNNFVLKSSTNFKNSLSLYNYFLFSGGGGGATDGSAGYSGGGGFGTYKVGSNGIYGYSISMTYPIADASTNYYVNQMPTTSAFTSGAVSGFCPGAGGGGIGSQIYNVNGKTIGGNGAPGTVKISFTSYYRPNISNLFNITGNAKQYSITLANGLQYYIIYCYPGTSTISCLNNNFIFGTNILAIGGGGGGAGGGYFTANATGKPGTFISGAGGGGGGICLIENISLVGKYNITVGAGGTGGFGGSINTQAINGSIGGNTTVTNGGFNIVTCTGGAGGNSFSDVTGGTGGLVTCNNSYTGGSGGSGGSGGQGYNGKAGSNIVPLSGTSSALVSYSLPDGTIIYCGGGGGGGSARYSDSQYISGVPKVPLNYVGGAAGYGYGGLVGSCINPADPSLNSLDLSSNGGNGIFWGSGGGGGSSNASSTNKTYGGSGGDGAVLFIIPANGISQLNALQQNIINTSNALSAAQYALDNYNPLIYNSWFANYSINSYPISWVGIGIANNGYINLSSFDTLIYTSDNYASTFRSISVGTGHREIVISANGQYGIVCNPGPWYIFTTNNFGNTWIQTANFGRWQTIAASTTCQYSIVGTNGLGLYYSNDYGTTYNSTNITDGFAQVAISSSGQYGLASYHSGQPFQTASTGQIYYSNNYGQSWSVSNTPVANWGECAIEDNGIGYAVNNADFIYKTTNYGQTWSAITSSGALGWSIVRMDSSGQNLLAAQNLIGYIYCSSDYGISWNQTNCPYMSAITNLCISRNGQFAAVCGYNDYVYFTPFNSASQLSYSQLVANVNSAQLAYNNAVYSYQNASNILSTTSIMPLSPAINNNNSLTYSEIDGIESYLIYGLSNNYISGTNNILTSNILTTNTTVLIDPFINNLYYYYLLGYNGGISTIQSVSTMENLYYNSSYNTLSITGTVYSICSDSTGQYIALCIYGGGIYNSTNYGQTWFAVNPYPPANWRSICRYYNNEIKYAACIYGGGIYNNIRMYYWNENTTTGALNWSSVASSSDGKKLAACVDGGYVYTSTDSGNTWTPRIGIFSWKSITSSSDGTRLAVVYNILNSDYTTNGTIYISSDSGNTWTNLYSATGGNQGWVSISSSANGLILMAIVSGGAIYISTNYGTNWVTSSLGNNFWHSIKVSPNGATAAVVQYNNGSGSIYTSTNSGSTWTQKTITSTYKLIAVACSNDGTKLAAISNNGYIYTSTNSGNAWTQQISSGSFNWVSITSSYDGTRLAACVNGGYIYTSADSGTTWIQQSGAGYRNWTSICSDISGTKLVATVSNGYIYTYDLSIFNQLQSTAPTSNWTSICSDISGTNFAACIDNGGIYISSNSSTSWVNTNAPTTKWTSICCNNIGTKFFACSNGSGIYYSISNPTTWTQCYSSTANFTSICCDITATYIYSCVNGGKMYSSSNSGSTWIQTSLPTANWSSISCSSSGSTVAICASGSTIYISANFGKNWSQTGNNGAWSSISLSSNGYLISANTVNGSNYNFTSSIYTLQTPIINNLISNSLVTINYTAVAEAQSYAAYLYTTNTFTISTPNILFNYANSTNSGTITVYGINSGIPYYAIIVGYTRPNLKGIAFQSPYSNSFTYLLQPSIPTIQTITSTNVVINYTYIAGAQSYAAYINTSTTFTQSTIGDLSGSINSTTSGVITVNNINPISTYYAIIVAYSGLNITQNYSTQSPYSISFGFLNKIPAAPIIQNVTSSSVTLYYTTIANALSYAIYINTTTTFTAVTGGNLSNFINSTNNGTITISSINPTTTYYAIVVAYSGINKGDVISIQSPYSTSFGFINTIPSTPTVNTVTSSSIVMNYQIIPNAQSYAIFMNTTTSFTPTTVGDLSGSINSFNNGTITINNINPISTYYAILVAYSGLNRTGVASIQSPYSSSVGFFNAIPAAPTVTSYTYGATFNFTSIPLAQSYTVYINTNNTFTASSSGNITGSINSTTSGSITISSGLYTGITYYSIIVAFTGLDGSGVASNKSPYSSSFTPILPFTITNSTNYISTISTVNNTTYNILKFKAGSFNVVPTTNINLYQVFVVGRGANGSGHTGGAGGGITYYNDISTNNPIIISPSNCTMQFLVNSQINTTADNTATININSIITTLNSTVGGGSTSYGPQNYYTQLYYGGGGGAGGELVKYGATGIGGGGGLGGGGGGGGSYTYGVAPRNGGAGGGVGGGLVGGAGGIGEQIAPVAGVTSQYGGGGGGATTLYGGNVYAGAAGGGGGIGGGVGGGSTELVGGGGGGGGYYGGGGGGYGFGQTGGAKAGGGGAGTILLVYKV